MHAVHLGHMQAPNPKDPASGLRMLGRVLELPPVRVFDATVDVKAQVTRELERPVPNAICCPLSRTDPPS